MREFRPKLLQDISDDVYYSVRALEDSFAIGTPGLKIITEFFMGALEKGLTVDGGDIPMNVTWTIGYPTGQERGQYLTLDMGGTCLRAGSVTLSGRDNGSQVIVTKCKIPEHLMDATADDLWDFVADRLQSFIHDHHLPGDMSSKLPLAWTFSYPISQHSVRHGVLQYWTKSFTVRDVVGRDVVLQLQEALERKQVPIEIVALANDTTGTLIASAYRDPDVKIGSIVSTGCNSAYMEERQAIPKIDGCSLPGDTLIAINTECGAFGNTQFRLPRTSYDEMVDKESEHPGLQLFEKMIAGLYLGELLRLTLVELHAKNQLFLDQDISRLQQTHVLDTSFLAAAEEDRSASLDRIHDLSRAKLGIAPNFHDRKIIRYIVEVIGTRAARLYACSIAAICKKKNIERCHVGVDGRVFSNYSNFRSRAAQALREIFDWPHESEDLIVLQDAEEGSQIGAALIAALAVEKGGDDIYARQP